MKSFLEHVADDIIAKYGTDLSRTAIVFPNKRASLFLNDALARLAGKPIWSPAYITISDLFRRHSRLQVADPIKLICDLHRSYADVTGSDETLDHFYGWGQLLLSDFDDIDKNLAPADKVFANLRDLHELDDLSYLTDEQCQMLRKFFANFSDQPATQLKERFLRLWSHIGDIYRHFNQRLADQGLAYEGALYRSVATDSDTGFEYDRYLFVGFNLLQPVEQRLFTTLRQQGKARFYWDFDHYYMNSEAGLFIAQQLDKFPSELDTTRDDIFRTFTQPKDITFVSASTENIQARYVSHWLSQGKRIADGRRTAIVLCNENLLPAVVYCLPDEVEKVNITTGYPLYLSPVTSLLGLLLTLQTTGYDSKRNRFRLRQASAVLKHPYISRISATYTDTLKYISEQHIYYPDTAMLTTDDGLSLVFGTHCTDNLSLLRWLMAIVRAIATSPLSTLNSQLSTLNSSPLTDESLFRTYTLLNRLATLMESGDLNVDVITLQRLLTQLVQSVSVPFHGEPAEGVQIMGVLETRNLDFDHLLLLSTNEGNMPRGITDSSFIPYSIRKAFGLTTVDHRVAIYSYYFHRLLSRAHDITLVYNNATTDGQTGEMSRFMLQMLVESPHIIRQETLQAGQTVTPRQHAPVEKTPAIVDKLRERFTLSPLTSHLSPLLTPTAINRYMRCPLQFYYCYVEGLREPDDTDDDTIDNRTFGNIFHKAAQIVYEQLMQQKGNHIVASDLQELLRSKVPIELAVDSAFREELFHLSPQDSHLIPEQSSPTRSLSPLTSHPLELNGLQIINREVIVHYLRQLLQLDCRLAPFTILALEKPVVQSMPIRSLGITTTIGGLIDRLDSITLDGQQTIRVVDYKTGAHRLQPMRDVDAIFDQSQLANHSDYYLQTLLYARIVRQQHNEPVAPALLFIQHAAADDYDPILCFGSERIADVATPEGDRFVKLLMEKVEEIFTPDQPFTPTADQDRCRTCPYAHLCGL